MTLNINRTSVGSPLVSLNTVKNGQVKLNLDLKSAVENSLTHAALVRCSVYLSVCAKSGLVGGRRDIGVRGQSRILGALFCPLATTAAIICGCERASERAVSSADRERAARLRIFVSRLKCSSEKKNRLLEGYDTEIISSVAQSTCHPHPAVPRGSFVRDIKIAAAAPRNCRSPFPSFLFLLLSSDRCATRPQWRDQHFCARATDFSLSLSLSLSLPHLLRIAIQRPY